MKVDVRHHRLNVRNMTVEEFAAEVGVTVDVIRNLEETGNRPQPKNAAKVARYFSLPSEELWPLEEARA